MIYLDTHLVVWLYMGETALLSSKVARLIEREEPVISPIVLLELQYLREIERLVAGPDKIIEVLGREIGLEISQIPLLRIVRQSLAYTWTRDPFDRIIVAEAALDSSSLLTKDRSILKHYRHAVWE